jgi:hypothetical protein
MVRLGQPLDASVSIKRLRFYGPLEKAGIHFTPAWVLWRAE